MSTNQYSLFTPKKAAWNVPVINPQAYIAGGFSGLLLSTGKRVEDADLKYTIIDHEKVVFRDVHELAELYQATKIANLVELVSFRPERIALQQSIASVITRVQLTPQNRQEEESLEHDKMLERLSQKVYEYSASTEKYTEEISELYKKREEIEEIISATVAGQSVSSSNSALVDACKAAVKKCTILIVNDVLGEHVDNYSKDTALIALATDLVYNKYANQKMNQLINQSIDELASKGEIKLLTIPDAADRKLFMLSGGQASGKGVACAMIRHSAEQSNVSWVNISKGGRDNFRKLLEPKDIIPELSDQLTANEGAYIHWTLANGMLVQMAKEGKAPHIYSEQPIVSEDMLELALTGNGSAKVVLVSTKVEDAVERAYKRGLEIGRFVPTKSLLSTHKNATVTLPERLAKVAGMDVELLVIDNNVPKNSPPVKIAVINCLNNEIIIYDNERVMDFIKKTAINADAKKPADVYDEAKVAAVSIDVYFEPCIKNGYKVVTIPDLELGINILK